MCVFGELFYKSFLPGLLCGLIFIFICILNSENKKNFFITVFLISILGYLFDTILVFYKVYYFETSLNYGFLPIWMIILWPSFATLFDEIFVFLSKYKIIAVLLSSILGPLTYFAGSPLGILYINNLSLFFVLMIIFWAALMFFYLNIVLKFKLN